MISSLQIPALLALSGLALIEAAATNCAWVRFDEKYEDYYLYELAHGDSALNTYKPIQKAGANPLPKIHCEKKRNKDELLIYDTSFMGPMITGADPDLEVGEENAIIVQRPGFHDKVNYPDTWQVIGRPDDNPDGGWIRFSTVGGTPVYLKDIEFVDNDEVDKLPLVYPYLDGYYAYGAPDGGYVGPATGGKETGQLWLQPAAYFNSVDIRMRSSGGVLGLYICEDVKE